MSWDWLPSYMPLLLRGLYLTILILTTSVVFGFILSIMLSLLQIAGPRWARHLVASYCNFIRGTPLLIQLWLLYYGVGSLFPLIPALKTYALWLIRLDALYYAIFAFTLSFAGYVTVILTAALENVPKGELEAARALGLGHWRIVRRIWLPRAMFSVLPTLTGEVISQLKATPVAYTIPIMELMGVAAKIRHDTLRIYEPLLLVGFVYFILTLMITAMFHTLEKRNPLHNPK